MGDIKMPRSSDYRRGLPRGSNCTRRRRVCESSDKGGFLEEVAFGHVQGGT